MCYLGCPSRSLRARSCRCCSHSCSLPFSRRTALWQRRDILPIDQSINVSISQLINQHNMRNGRKCEREIAAQFEGTINQSLLLVEREIRPDSKYRPSSGRRNVQFHSTLPMRLHRHQYQMRGSVTSSSDTAYGGHAWVVPPTDMLVSH